MSEDQSPIEFEIYMTDVTLNESDGVFDVANSIMNKHSCNAKRNEWFIRSNIGVLNNFGYNEFVCQFDNNKNVFIVSYCVTRMFVHNRICNIKNSIRLIKRNICHVYFEFNWTLIFAHINVSLYYFFLYVQILEHNYRQ
jgi:hypothetical protein